MSMSTHVNGIREEDDGFKRMLQVAIACHQANVKLPDEVDRYFGGEFNVQDPMRHLKVNIPFEEKSTSYSTIWEIDISKIPKGVKKIRFENSY